MAQFIIETNQLIKRYHGKPVVNHLDLNICKGSIYGFLGPNGAGKSTTMKMLLGLIKHDGGTIFIGGKEMNDNNRVSILSEAGSLIENPSYYGNLTAYENLKITCMLRELPFQEIDRVLSVVRLAGQRNKKTAHYSLGMKQRLGLANALLGSPKLIFLDEPTNGLDPSGIHEMRELIKSLPKEYGMTVMVSSHLLSEIEQTADHIGIISGGQLIFQNTLTMLQSRNVRQIHLRTSNNGDAAVFLKKKDKIPQLASLEYSEDQGILIPFLPDSILCRLLKQILEQGIDIYRIEERTQNLEDIYLEMVKEAGL